MDAYEQQPFGDAEFATNPEQRVAVVLLIDTSYSMNGDPIRELNAGLLQLKEELMKDSLAVKRVDIAMVTFGPVTLKHDFSSPEWFYPETLEADGGTPMGEAIVTGIEMIKDRKKIYRENGIKYYRPWVFLITDGRPTDNYEKAKALVHEGEKQKDFLFYAVAVRQADMACLAEISVKTPLKLKGLSFRELFIWLSSSLSAVSASNLGDITPLENPAAPNGWAVVD